MKTLKQIWIQNGGTYKTPLTGSLLFQKRDIKEWLQQKQKRAIKGDYRPEMRVYKELLEELEQ